MAFKIIPVIIVVSVVIVAGLIATIFGLNNNQNISNNNEVIIINSFEECANAGYPVVESYPEQCRTPEGRTFVKDISQELVKGACYIGGCSSQVCSDQKDIITTCEYKKEYACYKTAKCERQTDGQCGWTETVELRACLMKNQ